MEIRFYHSKNKSNVCKCNFDSFLKYFVISNGVFKARRGMRFFYLEELSDGMVDVVLGKEVMSLLGTMVTLQENYVIFRSKRDSRMERTVYFGLKPASMDLGVRASDNVLFHMHDPTIGQ